MTDDDLVGSSDVVEESLEAVAGTALEEATTVVLQQTLLRLETLVLLGLSEDRQKDVCVGVREHDVTRLDFNQP